jgi:hypothetical protein
MASAASESDRVLLLDSYLPAAKSQPSMASAVFLAANCWFLPTVRRHKERGDGQSARLP